MNLVTDQAAHGVDAVFLEAPRQLMLFASSKRARNSTTAVTCLPLFTAFSSAPIMRGSAAGAIKGLLDRQHIGVCSGLF